MDSPNFQPPTSADRPTGAVSQDAVAGRKAGFGLSARELASVSIPGPDPVLQAPAVQRLDTYQALTVEIERQRERFRRSTIRVGKSFIERATHASFQFEGVVLPPGAVREAMTSRVTQFSMRTRLSQRIRNYASIQFQIERMLRQRVSLSAGLLTRWYTGLSGGLVGTQFTAAAMGRLSAVAYRVNVPSHRIQAALLDVACLQAELSTNPILPSFSGMFSRLVLHMSLGRCGLPPVVLESSTDQALLSQPSKLADRLAQLVYRSYLHLGGF